MGFWYKIIEWFKNLSDRYKLIASFNDSAKLAYVSDIAPVLLKASISLGDKKFKHCCSGLYSGFRIKAMAGRALTKSDMVQIGKTILSNNTLVKQMLVLGFDTLEVHDDVGSVGLKWQLKGFVALN